MPGDGGCRPAGLLVLAGLLFLAPAVAGAADSDRDGVDDAADVCRAIADSSQLDSDRDGYGNACDADFDQDGIVGWYDRSVIDRAFGAREGSSRYDEALDLDGDGLVGIHEHQHVIQRLGTPPGPSGLSCAGEIPCHAGRVQIDLAEEALSRSVRLTWRTTSPAISFEVERRVAGRAWERVARVSGFERSFVDQGAALRGLAPGTYEYRVLGGGPASEARAVTIREECAGQPPTSPTLPVVEIVDHEPDGDHDGADVTAALAACSRLHGCVLRALPVVYRDVNAQLALETRYDFSHGLVIEGHGSATVFRSRVFSAQDHDPRRCAAGAPPPCYVPRPVFSIQHPGTTRLDGVRFRNFQIDGRKREQPDPGLAIDATWEHWGIVVLSSTLEFTDGGCVHNVTAHDLMSGGFGVQRANGWIFENSSVYDVGCQADLTPCNALVRTPEYLNIPGVQQPAVGILAGPETDGTVVRDNRVQRAVKYGIAAVFGASGFHFHDNVVEKGGGAGIQCNICRAGVIERNLVQGMHYPTGRNATWPGGYGGELGQGIQCTGPARQIRIADNIVINGEGSGVRLQCSGPDLLLEGNAIIGNCRKRGESLVVADGEGALVRNNVVSDQTGGCRYSMFIASAHGAQVEGGSVTSGPGTAAGVFAVGTAGNPTTGLLLRKLRISGRGAGVGLYLAPTSSGTTLYDSTCSSGFPTPFVDQSSGGAARRLVDPAGACSP